MSNASLVLGSTGLIGKKLIFQLAKKESEVIAISRRSINNLPENVCLLDINFDDFLKNGSFPSCDHIYICLGTTIKKAGSQSEFKKVDFDYDGEMQPDVALNPEYKETYPFSKIVGNANILIMPALHSASISVKIMKTFGGAKLIGPLLIGLGLPIEIAPLRSSPSEILNLASIAAYSSEVINYKD